MNSTPSFCCVTTTHLPFLSYSYTRVVFESDNTLFHASYVAVPSSLLPVHVLFSLSYVNEWLTNNSAPSVATDDMVIRPRASYSTARQEAGVRSSIFFFPFCSL